MDADEQYKDWVRNLTERLKKYFFLNEWTILLEWLDESSSKGTAAEISINTRYLYATIEVCPPVRLMWDNDKIEDVVETIVHEFSHILTEPLYEVACDGIAPASSDFLEKIREQQTQRTALIILRGLPKKFFKYERVKGLGNED